MTEPNKERVIHSDVQMAAVETVVGTEGLIKRDWFLYGNPDVLKTGETIFVQTRKPWPAHVLVTEPVATPPEALKKRMSTGMVCTEFQFVPREQTKRVAGEVRVSQGERIDKLQSEVGTLIAQNAELLALLTKAVNGKK